MKIWFLSRFSNLSIRGKLVVVILVSTLPPLVAGFSYVVFTDLRQFRGDLLASSDLVTRSVSSYLAVGLAFDDPVETNKAIEPLRALEQIVAVYLYDIEGRVFQTYHRAGDGDDIEPPSLPTAMSTSIDGGVVHSVQPVTFDGRRYGTIYIQSTADALDERIRAYSVRMTLLGLALIALSVLGAYVCQGLISQPIQRLVAATRRISEAADYSVRVEKEGDDEIGILSDAFNAMVEQIESRQAELQRSNRDLDQFAYVASHDLKAPLRAISTLSAWIEEDVDEHLSDESREQMQLLRSRVQRMDRLIEGILQYSRVGRTDSAGESVDTGSLVAELIGYLEPPDGMTIEIADAMPTMVARRLRLEQVFQNLISNAIKYHHQPTAGCLRIG
ncbi:MAG: HAMP domain-containing protein, partial [Acidobacteriota bacterium]